MTKALAFNPRTQNPRSVFAAGAGHAVHAEHGGGFVFGQNTQKGNVMKWEEATAVIDAMAERFSAIVNSQDCTCDERYTCTIHKDAQLSITARCAIAWIKEVNARHTMNAIMRICPDCGDDMCGPEHKDCYKCQLEAARMRHRYHVDVFGETTGKPKSKYTIEADSDNDALLIAFAQDGGFNQEADASDMLELAKEYCEIVHKEVAA